VATATAPTITVDPIGDALVDAKLRRILWILFGAVGFVLLIALPQAPRTVLEGSGSGARTFPFAVKTKEPEKLLGLVASIAASLDPQQPLAGLGTLEGRLGESNTSPRFQAAVFGGLGRATGVDPVMALRNE